MIFLFVVTQHGSKKPVKTHIFYLVKTIYYVTNHFVGLYWPDSESLWVCLANEILISDVFSWNFIDFEAYIPNSYYFFFFH